MTRILAAIETTKAKTLEDLLADDDFVLMVEKEIDDAPSQRWQDRLVNAVTRDDALDDVLREAGVLPGLVKDKDLRKLLSDRLLATLAPVRSSSQFRQVDEFGQVITPIVVTDAQTAATWALTDPVFMKAIKQGGLDTYNPNIPSEVVGALKTILDTSGLAFGEQLRTSDFNDLVERLTKFSSHQDALADPGFQTALANAVTKRVPAGEDSFRATTKRHSLLIEARALLSQQEGDPLWGFQGVKLSTAALNWLLDPAQGMIDSTMTAEEIANNWMFQDNMAFALRKARATREYDNVADYTSGLLTLAGRKEIFNKIREKMTGTGDSLITWEEFQKLRLEGEGVDPRTMEERLSQFQTVADAMNDEEFRQLFERGIGEAKDRDTLTARRELNNRDNLIALVTEQIAVRNIVGEDSSPQFLRYVLEEVIPSIVDQIPYGGIDNEETIEQIVEDAVQPGSWLPAYAWNEVDWKRQFREFQFSRDAAPPTKISDDLVGRETLGELPGFRVQQLPEFKLEQLQPKVEWLAYERPEFGHYIQEQLQTPGFHEAFVEANRPILDVKGAVKDISGFDGKLSLAEAELERLSAPARLTDELADLEEETVALQAQRQQTRGAITETERGPGTQGPQIEAVITQQQQEKAALDRNIAENQTKMARLQKNLTDADKEIEEAERQGLVDRVATEKEKVAKLRHLIGESPLKRQQFIAAVKEARRDRPVVTLGGFYEQQLADFERAFQKTPLYAMEQERVAKEQQLEQERVAKEQQLEQARIEAETMAEEMQRRQQLSGRPVTRFARVRR
jgi:hypothetical protein